VGVGNFSVFMLHVKLKSVQSLSWQEMEMFASVYEV
jgi:hypothetical protein